MSSGTWVVTKIGEWEASGGVNVRFEEDDTILEVCSCTYDAWSPTTIRVKRHGPDQYELLKINGGKGGFDARGGIGWQGIGTAKNVIEAFDSHVGDWRDRLPISDPTDHILPWLSEEELPS